MNTDILTCNMPSQENIALETARNLKKNYDQLGYMDGLNKSICSEINATTEHLYKSWKSNSSYYRSHYKNFSRFYQFLHWIAYKLSGFIWGHGEQVLNIILFMFLWICIIAFYLYLSLNYSIYDSIPIALSIFLGNIKPDSFSNIFFDIISIVRYIFIALFVSILIKKTGYR